jgi:hypothetical protein
VVRHDGISAAEIPVVCRTRPGRSRTLFVILELILRVIVNTIANNYLSARLDHR